jgi:hypothetical protein
MAAALIIACDGCGTLEASEFQFPHRAAEIPPSKYLCASRVSGERPRIMILYFTAMRGRATPLVIAFSLIAPDVRASPECMTKQEARAKWPTKPIYSHGSSGCWNNQPLSSRPSTTPPVKTSDSIAKARALVLPAPRPKATKTEVVNDSDLFNGAPMTGWRVLIDIDGHQVPDPNNGVDGCCWPSLDTLKALTEAVK